MSASESDTDQEYEIIRKKLDEFVELPDSEVEGTFESNEPYLTDSNIEIPKVINNEIELVELGVIYSVVDDVLIVQSTIPTPLALGTLTVLPDRTPLGYIGDTFGPVEAPFYSIKISIFSGDLIEGVPILYCPSLSKNLCLQELDSSQSESSDGEVQ